RVSPHLHSFPTRRSSDLAPVMERFDRVVAGLLAQEQLEVRPLLPESRQDSRQQERRDRRDYAHPELARQRLAARLDEVRQLFRLDRKSTRLNSSHVKSSY